MINIKEIEERYNKLSGEGQKQWIKGYEYGNLELVKDAGAYELLKDVLDEEKKIKEGFKMKEFIEGEVKTEKEQISKEEGKKIDTAENKALLVKKELSLEEWERIVKFLYESNYFKDLQSVAQAFAKAQCGRELGFTPFYSLQHIYIIPGKPPAVDGQAMGSLIKSRGYDFRAVEINDEKCTIAFFGHKGEKLGQASFTIQEADKILDNNGKSLSSKKVWKDYTQDMLWWRTLSRGARRYCPDAIAGVYYYEELDYELKDGEENASDISEFKVEPQKKLPDTKIEVEKTREDILEELVTKFKKERLVALKKKMGIEKSLLEIDDNQWAEFVKKLQGGELKEKISEKKEDELTKELKIEKLERLKKDFGVKKIKEIKEMLKFETKLVDLCDKDFNKFVEELSKTKHR